LDTKKRLYIGLLAASLLLEMSLAFMIWYVIVNRDIIISQIMLITVAVLLGIIFLILGMGILAIVIMIIKSRSIPSLEKLTLWANELLFPITLFIGRLLGVEKEKILKSFISVNNYIVAPNDSSGYHHRHVVKPPGLSASLHQPGV
jgi:hypothetical protein